MNADHSFWLTKWPPIVATIDETNVKAFYQQVKVIDGKLVGDKGRQQICPSVVRELWPDSYAVLRPLQYTQVPLSGGAMIGGVVKPLEVPTCSQSNRQQTECKQSTRDALLLPSQSR